jgi:hypothetical protein
MASNDTTMIKKPLVLVSEQNGVTVIPQPTPLTRLNYFDGKFLRASDLSAEQLYLRRLIDLSNQAGGPGVAYGYNLSLAAGGDQLNLGPGLAIDPQGRVLLLPQAFSVGVQHLIDRSRQLKQSGAAASGKGSFGDCSVVMETPPDGVVQAGNLYLIVIGFAEALCGEEDVFGKLCEEACATSTDRPFLVEGLVLRAVPLQLQTPLPTSAVVSLNQRHLRSRVASAYFEDERQRVASFISGEGLRSDVWCFGAEAAGGSDVPVGVLARAGSTTVFLDAWIARRERIDTPARRYWQWRMAMRPWDVFLAQILQFQCQLSDLFRKQPPDGGDDDPCADAHSVIREANDAVAKIAAYYQSVTTRFTLQPLLVAGKASTEAPPVLEGGLTRLLGFRDRLQAANAALFIPSNKILIDGGIVEVSSAGYLPVTPNSVTSVNQQVTRLFGKGVDLRFCIVRPDFVAHALEEAQHMERISLLEGLDHPDRKPEVDILVPNGESLAPKPATGVAYEAAFVLGGSNAQERPGGTLLAVTTRPILRGAAHIDVPDAGNVQVFSAVDLEVPQPAGGDRFGPISAFGRAVFAESKSTPDLNPRRRPPMSKSTAAAAADSSPAGASLWLAATCSQNFFAAQSAGQTLLEIHLVASAGEKGVEDLLLSGTLSFERPVTAGAQRIVRGTHSGTLSVVAKFGATRKEQNVRVSHDVTAVLSTPDNSAPTLHMTLVDRQHKVVEEISASWSGSPRKITLSVREAFDFPGQETASRRIEQTLFEAVFTQNDDVLLPTNGLHAAALRALDALGAALGNPQFPPASAGLLFPPPPPAADDLQIRAVLDWVLFHRRRNKQCQPVAIVPVIPVRRYQLWHGLVANQDFLKKIIDALHNKAPFDKEGVAFQRVDVVEFAPGIQTLISPTEAVQADWTKIKPGQALLYGGIASDDAAKQDGPELAKGRLKEVELAVASISTPADSVLLEVLDDIHPDLAVPGVDGIIVALTTRQTTCVTVVQIVPILSADKMVLVRTAVSNGNIAEALKLGTVVGQVQFRTGTADVQDDSLTPVVKKWQDQGLQGLPNTALVAMQKGDSRVPADIARSQGRAIQVALGVGEAPSLQTSPKPLPDCPVILFVASQPAAFPRVGRVVVWRGRDAAGNRVIITAVGTPDVTFAPDGSLSGGVPSAVVTALHQVGLMGQIELAPVEDDFDAAPATKRLNAVADALVQSSLLAAAAPRTVTKLAPVERSLAGTTANEIIFVRPG